ncbi:ResC/HemX-like cytochrome c biogenesis membrane protein [Syntrophotalea carbinolica DSM 2380]|uniref:ResC/HemX-like cytochrome c biogenesis membrane protein n=1 Tax=Syntrophotalea carbinolica (strain DSM 2380 / NBRC 103641 / GraBd1) TaxID=338963 RepID=Q3A837_SYNC1|nr:cytochrome c biogenesis protein CcsA [Syntrophotalea carbinolica]ABA87455.1 ResC/HemX-like cytochrome c biogenesis membrane protein [Syntrophotalea carbinolica DSM 2380]
MTLATTSSVLFNVAAGVYAGSLLFYLFKQYRSSCWLLGIGFALHSSSQLSRCWRWGIFSLDGVFNGALFLPWCLALLGLFFALRGRQQQGASMSWLVTLTMLITLALPVQIPPPGPFTATWSSPMFFFLEVLAVACFLASGWYAWQQLRQRNNDELFNQLAIWGFILYSLAQVIGAVWSYLGWGAAFHWGERHLQSAAIWCLYCGYLHTHFDHAFNLRQKARWALSGALVVLVVAYALQVAAHLTVLNPTKDTDNAGQVTAAQQVHGAVPNACRNPKLLEDGND